MDRNTKTSLIGCTIADSTTARQAMVLAESFREFHPPGRFAILFLDRPPAVALRNTLVLGLGDLDLAPGEEWRLPMILDARAMMALLKPALLQTLLKSGGEVAAWFEYSTLILAPLTEAQLSDWSHPVVASLPIKNENGWSDFGRSFVAVRSEAKASLSSWFDRAWEESVACDRPSPRQDQLESLERVFDRVPHTIINSCGFALCYATANPNTFEATADGYKVDGTPLRSFDFRGYDPDKPHLLSRYQGLEPRILLSEHAAIAKICDEYLEKVRLAAQDNNQTEPVRPGFLPSGLRIDHRMQSLYREALQKWRAGEIREPPSPFGPEGEQGFMKWLNEPLGQTREPVTRYMLAVHEDRQDVRDVFPDPLGVHAAAFRDWYLYHGRYELELPAAVIPVDVEVCDAIQADRALSDWATKPVNVAGYFRAELGIGVAARSLVSALEAVDIPFNTLSFGATANRQSYPFTDSEVEGLPADLNIVCVNPDQLPLFAEQTGREFREGRYMIGVWFWEVEDFPMSLHGAFNYVDEVWVASDFMRQTFLKVSPKPVFNFRLPVLAPQIDASLSRADLRLPDRFIFLFSFDLLSVLERKNPLGLIKAFSSAFSNGEGPVLVIKTINGDKRCLEMEKLRYAVRGRSDIILMDGYLSHTENNTLTALCDCYVSLHRSEGFGLSLAEAMALAKPVIATAYSGNLDFMTAANSYLCPSHRCQVGPDREPYPAESYWSEPDLEVATGLLRHVYEHSEEAGERGRRAAEDIRLLHSPAIAGGLIRQRLVVIRRRRARTGPVPTVGLLEDRIDELEAENAKLRAGDKTLVTST